ncbi:hypothetical protein M9H77_19487 [Catharanthus roseus]|uniref:Uncharacterized protein n=1 Tax=Catharanthus roseus TaxID=4058 RepID=A0ACC0BAD3_CATRO|nr:hypothetical protein M9H77_19487 [Catharanthus roseus]
MKTRIGFFSSILSSTFTPSLHSSVLQFISRPSLSVLLQSPAHLNSKRTITKICYFPPILRALRWCSTSSSASVSSMASSFKPEQARVPPAIQLPTPPITKASILITHFMIGLCQLSVTADKERNILHARTAIVEAAEKGAKLVVLPEIWNSPYSNDSFPEYAEDIDAGFDKSPSTAMLSEVARLLKVTIIGGSIPERSGDKLYNTCCVFGTDGELKAKHRKVVLLNRLSLSA